jgi:predicted DsbA family dithiol-disulfide isomerase
MEPIRISYYSDVLCVWAYIAQIRLDELAANFPDQVAIDYHFVSIFGNAHEKLETRWRDKGGACHFFGIV